MGCVALADRVDTCESSLKGQGAQTAVRGLVEALCSEFLFRFYSSYLAITVDLTFFNNNKYSWCPVLSCLRDGVSSVNSITVSAQL